jgi:nitrate reductase cytochrome c-type subunit
MTRRLTSLSFGFSGALTLLLSVFTAVVLARQEPAPSQPPPTAAAPAEAPAPGEVPEAVAACLACHQDPAMEMTFADGSTMSLHVDLAAHFTGSVHASQLTCTDCHAKYDEDHPMGNTFENRRAYTVNSYELCKKCHFDTYTRTLESVHYEYLKAGVDSAPICTDCHGAHNIVNPHEKRAMISRSCATCHSDVNDAYAKSVHGRALVEDGNQDVPACADCHTSHQVQQSGTTRFRLSSPERCITCHGNEPLMAKYGISTNVAKTYLADFHGATASLSRNLSDDEQQIVVTCSACHGVHDIASPRLLGAEVMKATVEQTCASCHQDAGVTFPAAWLSHYPPSLRHAPLVFAVESFYRFFIPFAVLGLILNLGLHVYRMSAGR